MQALRSQGSDSESLGEGIAGEATVATVIDEYDDYATNGNETQVMYKSDDNDHEEIDLGSQSVYKTPSPADTGSCIYKYLPGAFKYTPHLSYWNVEDPSNENQFWIEYGKQIATKNLWISIGNLTLAFSVWLIWSVVIILIYNAWDSTCNDENADACYYSFTSWQENMNEKEYKSVTLILPATAGLTGATLRLTNSFMIAPCGGRIAISQTSILLLISMIALTIALNNTNVDFIVLIAIAVLTGAGGGAFASSMSNISYFYPKSKQGLSLGICLFVCLFFVFIHFYVWNAWSCMFLICPCIFDYI